MNRVWIPTTVTLVGLGCGALAALWMGRGALDAGLAVWWVGVLADNVDGTVARRLDAVTPLGGQLDALGDLVLYAVAPFLFVATTGTPGLVAGLALLVAAAWRLANDVVTDAKGVHFGALVVVYFAAVPWAGPASPELFAVLNALWLVFSPALPQPALRLALAVWGAVGLTGAVIGLR